MIESGPPDSSSGPDSSNLSLCFIYFSSLFFLYIFHQSFFILMSLFILKNVFSLLKLSIFLYLFYLFFSTTFLVICLIVFFYCDLFYAYFICRLFLI